MDDAARVGVVECIGDLAQQYDRAFERQRAGRAQKLEQRIALDQLHDEEVDVVLLANIEDLDDVRVAQRGRDLAFADEALDDALVNLGGSSTLMARDTCSVRWTPT